MKAWLLTVVAASVFLSLTASLLPENGVKRSVMTALGFVFLLVLATPVINVINRGFSYDVILSESISQADSMGTGAYIENVVESYRQKLSDQCLKALCDLEGYEAENVELQIESDTENGDFGRVLWVKCCLRATGKKEQARRQIEKIVIDWHGVRTEGESDGTADEKRISKTVQTRLAELLGISQEVIYVVYQ